MTRDEFEHLIRAAADAVGEDEFVVVGSQAVLGSFPDAPSRLLRSQEADLYPVADPDKAMEVDGALGEGSMFHDTYGYYAHGVGPGTAKAPAGWHERLVPLLVENPVTGQEVLARCLEIHDLVLSKCVAGRDRDFDFAETAIDGGLADPGILFERIPDLPVSADRRTQTEQALRGILVKLGLP